MSYQIIEPVNQVRLTNVAVVRLSRHGHRFEVACYKNKIVNYRQGTETDLSEVLQTERIFTNVSKGQFANSKTLKKCFDTADEEVVCRFILDKGDVQVSDQERAAQLEGTIREVASMVSEKCVDPVSRRPYTMAQIRDAMKGAGFMVHPTHNVKQQFLNCVKLIQKKGVLDIQRAKMKLALVLLSEGDNDHDHADRRNNAINLLVEEGVVGSDISPPTSESDGRIVFQSDPSLYRKMECIARDSSVQGRLEIIEQCVTEEGDVTLGSELERRAQHHQQQQKNADEEEAREKQSRENDAIAASSEDADVQSLSNKLQTNLTIKENDAPSSIDDDDEYNNQRNTKKGGANSRKAQKAAQKKSKKAKRREKEEQAERDERIAAEKTRQRERAERLGIADDNNNVSCHNVASSSGNGDKAVQGASGGGGGGDAKPCNTCGGAFAPGEYRLHFRSDWHRYNVKLKMKGVTPVSEQEFLICDSDAFFD